MQEESFYRLKIGSGYQRMLRTGRMNLTKQGVYDPVMMNVLKRARCTVERTNFECTLSGE